VVPAAVVGYQGPGDVTTFSNWWGLRAYSAATCGNPCIDVVDNVGANLATINSTAAGDLDATTLNAYISGHNNPTLITKVYDQIGGKHLSQATVGDMPLINTAPPVITKPFSMNFSNLVQFLKAVAPGTIAQPYSLMTVANRASFTNFSAAISSSTNFICLGWENAANTVFVQAGGANQDVTVADTVWHTLLATITNATTGTLYVNGSSNSITPGGTTAFGAGDWYSGTDGGSGGFVGNIVEIGLVASAADSAASSLSTNQKTYWGF
jgi:hypothetical protein